MRRVRACTLILSVCGAVSASGATYTVSSIADLRSRIASVAPGDTIIMTNGVYNSGSSIVIDRQGTASQPITITAQTIGGVEITGSAGFTFTSTAAYVVLRGFKFTHTAGAVSLPSGSHHCRITRNDFRLSVSTRGSYLVVSGNDHEVDRNIFHDKNTEGQMLSVQGPGGSGMAQRTWIHHNYFLNFLPSGANNSGALHIGHSARSLTGAFSMVEYNLFVNTRGENEGSVTNKSSDNIYRYNTFGTDTQELSLRHGNRCQVYGNFFVRSLGGLRFFGDDHRIYSNYFEACTKAIQIGNGDCTIPPGALTCHDRPDGVHVTFNTLVNNSRNAFMSGRTNGLGATGLAFANNIIQGGPTAVTLDGPVTGATWEGNIVWNTTPDDIRGHTVLNPQLVEDGNSEFRLSAGSPAIDRAAGTYSYVTVDMDQQARGSTKDAGADEFSTAGVINRILTPGDVGPNSGMGPTPTPTAMPVGPTPTPTATPTPTPTRTPTPTPNGCVTASAGGGFLNTSIPTQSGSFSVEFDATPSASPINSVVALSQGAQTAHTGYAALVRFNPSGQIDARNGTVYQAASSIPYAAGVSHHFRLLVDVPAHTYTIFVQPAGGSELTVGTSFAFRGEQASVTSLNNWAVWVNSTPLGSTQVCNFLISSTTNPTPTPSPTPTPTPAPTRTPTPTPSATPTPPACVTATSGGGFLNTSFPTQSGSFAVEFDATPSVSPINSVMALSQGAQTAHTGFAALARFNPSGQIDARNGTVYQAASSIPYSAGVAYHFRLLVDVPARTYTIFVRPTGGTELTVGTSYAFRGEQASVTSLNNWAVWVNSTPVGSTQVCSFALGIP